MWRRLSTQISVVLLAIAVIFVIFGVYFASRLQFLKQEHAQNVQTYATDTEAIQHDIVTALVLVSLLIIGLVFNFVMMLTFSVRMILSGMNRFKQGDYTYRIPLVSKNEFGDIAAYLNGTIEQIERSHRELEEKDAVLETKVRERTNDLERALVQVRDLNELRNKFVQIVSHQLRTPLNAMRWNLEALLSGQMGTLTKEQKTFVRITHDADVEIIARIRDLLTVLDIQEGRVVLAPQEISIESLWGSVLVDWKKRCDALGVVCRYVPSKRPLPVVLVDAEKIREVFQKLTENALNYTHQNGHISAAFERTAHAVRFEITDTGIGIPAHEQSHIFTPFFRATNASGMKPDASGIGLAIGNSFVKQHGGEMGFHSKEGKGSTFWFTIPLVSKTKRK